MQWIIPDTVHPDADSLARALDLPALIGRLLVQRGHTTVEQARRFLDGTLTELPDPFLLKDMDVAVARLERALTQRERICVVSDYDVDGLTSTALLVRVLQGKRAADISGPFSSVITYAPHRVKDGYGFSEKAVAFAKGQGASVVITVDSGTTAHAALAYAREEGLDVIVVDHHELQGLTRPPAYALINLLQPGCPYPEKDLASVGLAFKLAQALVSRWGQTPSALWQHLDLVCLGTVADVAPLVGENRVLVRHGLQRLAATPKAGLKALMAVAEVRPGPLTTEHVGFILGPRINAAGRMSAPDSALRLLLTDDPAEAKALAVALHEENRVRQRVEASVVREALEQAERTTNFTQHRAVVVAGHDWHPGVIGIVAARLVERYHRPAVVIALTDGVGKGSARSIAGFHLVDALAECRDRLTGFGGHEMAAGLTIAADQVAGFRDALNAVAQRRLTPDQLVPTLFVDAEVPLVAMTPALVRALERLGPFGVGNPRPVFASHGLALHAAPQPRGRAGIRCWVRAGRGPVFECSGFDRADRWRDRLLALGKRAADISGPFSLAYTPTLSTWQGQDGVVLQIKDVQEAGSRVPSPLGERVG
ncbi:MAG: single-stranded-DNA-specific exonuclease RecJ [Candidatus Omnitrophica bacterium]|nr:single-stranded-DNA-specific exonuclease RecJ [Candidatus Omnitrophota bacterium]